MKKQSSAYVMISIEAQRALYLDICERSHIEACGVLLGNMDEERNWQVEEIYPLCNIFDSPVYFEFAPEDLLAVELAQPGRIIGVYHSHPTGFPKASDTDRQNMQRVNQEQQIPWVWLIISGPFDVAFAQRARGHITEDQVIAYHHYEEGLQTISVLTESATDE